MLDSASSLPLFILADDKDACGITGAVINACPWRVEVSLSEGGLLSLRVRNEAGGELPVVVAGAYKGGWMNGAAVASLNSPPSNQKPTNRTAAAD